MGCIVHHSILVSTWSKERAMIAHNKAAEMFDKQVSDIIETPTNCYYTFYIAPDGSKEGWDDSDKGDKLREEYIQFLYEQNNKDGGEFLQYVEVAWADEKGESEITCCSYGSVEEE